MTGWRRQTEPGPGRIALALVGDTNVQGRDDPASSLVHVADTMSW